MLGGGRFIDCWEVGRYGSTVTMRFMIIEIPITNVFPFSVCNNEELDYATFCVRFQTSFYSRMSNGLFHRLRRHLIEVIVIEERQKEYERSDCTYSSLHY